MADALATINLRATRQNRQGAPEQVQNNAGGYAFTVASVERLRRFLVLGVDGGTYYTREPQLTEQNAAVVLDWARNRTVELVDELVAISTAGRAPRQNPTLFALAAAASLGDTEGRKAALAALPIVARTGTHLFLFARYVEQFRGWGRGLRRAVADWYTSKPVDKLAYQAVKYRQREGWSHRDLLRLAHASTGEPERQVLFDWICRPDGDMARQLDVADRSNLARAAWSKLDLVTGFRAAQRATTARAWTDLIGKYRLPWEALPDAALNEAAVWEALISNGLPQTALMRQLPRLTRLGLLGRMSETGQTVMTQLVDGERLRKARVHPVNVLVAARTYASGLSARGDSTWQPEAGIIDALDAAFYAAFGSVESTGKRTLLALDVSGSMGAGISGLPLSCREASAALALVTASVEPAHEIVGFTSGSGRVNYSHYDTALTKLAISPRQRLTDAIHAVSNLPFGGTDCALPMLWAYRNKVHVDTFQIYTDNETWAGDVHPHQALREYRDRTGIDARVAVVGMTATDFTIADPNDPGMLDVAGFDTAVPQLLTDFSNRAV